jgi:hypothetical protein
MAPGNPWPFNEYIEIGQLVQEGTTNSDFVGIKIGDVNNSVQANATQITPRSGQESLRIKATGKGNLEAGEEIEVQLTFPELVSGFQWTMETKGLSFAGISSEDIIINEQNIGLLENGLITMSWNGGWVREDDDMEEMNIVVKFKVNTAGKLMDMLDLTGKVTPAEAYTEAGEIRDVNLTFNSAGIFTDFALYQNKPNPWNNHTLIGFHLPVDAPATLTVFDLNGQVIKSITGQYKAGYNSVVLSVEDISTAGVYYYRLESGGYVASKKMVMVR